VGQPRVELGRRVRSALDLGDQLLCVADVEVLEAGAEIQGAGMRSDVGSVDPGDRLVDPRELHGGVRDADLVHLSTRPGCPVDLDQLDPPVRPGGPGGGQDVAPGDERIVGAVEHVDRPVRHGRQLRRRRRQIRDRPADVVQSDDHERRLAPDRESRAGAIRPGRVQAT
jgi:hypothetical protein